MYRWSGDRIKVLFDIVPLRVIPPLVFGSIVYGLVGLVPTAIAFWKFQLVLVRATIEFTYLHADHAVTGLI